MADPPGAAEAPDPGPRNGGTDRRQRIHELVLGLLGRQGGEIELLAGDGVTGAGEGDPGLWLERNRRVVQRYQALVRSAITLDALIDQDVSRNQ